jgi:cytochrome c oxidase cbb3-type subunit 1
MYSTKLIDVHFWTSTIGVVLYIVAMWIAGVMQGLMWRTFNDDGTLTYASSSPEGDLSVLCLRLLGGLLFLIGMLIMVYNVWMTDSRRETRSRVEVRSRQPRRH